MDAHQIHAKLPLAPGAALTAPALLPLFHAFIQEQALANELLIDVADYSHVQDGPLLVLIAHESHYALDRSGGRLGLAYARKREVQPVPPAQRLVAAWRRLFVAASLVSERAQVAFDTRELWLSVVDRLRAPNTPATWEMVQPEITEAAQQLYGAGVKLTRQGDEREPLSVHLQAEPALSLQEILARLARAT